MSRQILSAAAYSSVLFAACGCAHFVESRVIEQFAASLARDDLDALKARASDRFERKALRLAESLDDLEILRLPEGETSIVNVEDISDHEKRIVVKVGDSNRRLLYKLIRDAESEEWFVDDIFMKQKHKGITAVKSVTEQMDLLLTVREFLAAWSEGGRNDVLRVTTPEFGQRLSELPLDYLAQLTTQVAGERVTQSKFRPEAQMDQGTAIVRLLRTTGELIISFKRQAGSWKVDDVAVEVKGSADHIPSVSKRALIAAAAIEFLEAYNADDKQALSQVCTETFFESLTPADLSGIALPDPDVPQGEYRVKNQGAFATFTLPGEDKLINISLSRQDETASSETAPYLVQEVTIYELESRQEKRLSALFTAHATMLLFAEALNTRELQMLSRLSTPDFDRRVWNRLDQALLNNLPLTGLEKPSRDVIAVEYRGAVTRMTIAQGSREMTYVLRDWNGKLRVDDILLPAPKRPASLKTTLELMIPIRKFASAIVTSHIERLQRNSSSDFNRLVWKQVDDVPNLGVTVSNHLREPLDAIELRAAEARIRLGNEQTGALVELLKEHDRWVVDDVLLIAGLEPDQRRRLKKTLRTELADNFKTLRRAENPADKD